MPIFDQQTSILSKLVYYMSQKSQWDAPFSNYHEKVTALMFVFCIDIDHDLPKIDSQRPNNDFQCSQLCS